MEVNLSKNGFMRNINPFFNTKPNNELMPLFTIDESAVSKRAISFFRGVLLFLALMTIATLVVFAKEPELTTLFDTDAFRGSWDVISKFGWVGQILNFIISAFCMLGMAFILYQKIVTIIYFSNKAMWNNVSEIKKEYADGASSGGRESFGVKGYLGGFTKCRTGSGVDSVVVLLYMFLPDVKRYSEYGDKNLEVNTKLKEDDNIVTWFIKTFPTTIALLFFLAIGFNGTLMKSYGCVVNGLGKYASQAINSNLTKYTDRFLAMGDNYSFAFGQSGKDDDKLRQDIAEKIYGKIISKAEVLDGTIRNQVGDRVAEQVKQRFTNQAMQEVMQGVTGDKPLTDKDWQYVSISVVDNPTADAGSKCITISGDDCGIKNQNVYYHVFIKTSGRYNGKNYFEIETNKQDE